MWRRKDEKKNFLLNKFLFVTILPMGIFSFSLYIFLYTYVQYLTPIVGGGFFSGFFLGDFCMEGIVSVLIICARRPEG